MRPPAAFGRYRAALEERLRAILPAGGAPQHPDELYRMLRYHLGWEDAEGRPASGHAGKALRPTLCLLACEAAGGDWRTALPAAAAIELVHNFTLIHDDIQDHDPERRHRPTVWRLWGEAQAINAGDALLALGRSALLDPSRDSVSPAAVVTAAAALDGAVLETVEGQVLDITFEERLDVSEEAYLGMVEKKTGALFGCAMQLGGLAADAPEDTVVALARCGRELGVAFQLHDDALGVWGSQERTGKQPAADIRNRKKSLPVVRALSALQGQAASELRDVYGKHELSEEDVRLVLDALEAAGAEAYCRKLAGERKVQALRDLESLPLCAGPAAELRDVAEYLLRWDS